MEPKISVPFADAVKVLKKELKTGEVYKYGDIKEILERNFKGINENQVSGLMYRLAKEDNDTAILDAEKQPGSRKTYKLKESLKVSGKTEGTARQQIELAINKSLQGLREIPMADVQTKEDFDLLKRAETRLKDLLEELVGSEEAGE
ncbi:hypothetical protein CN495_08760 [Bacillus thuringiensis]|uniref:Transcriptional regulator n=1 Tax=Bacillus thuringiensis TaxID=1428 RepID=A0ABD6SL93_BACTU|nr:hypothetical protein [Bacillus thuringiensis]PER55832.1 hypothetical protein CN495_08760 [Bacillus thuringiensis]